LISLEVNGIRHRVFALAFLCAEAGHAAYSRFQLEAGSASPSSSAAWRDVAGCSPPPEPRRENGELSAGLISAKQLIGFGSSGRIRTSDQPVNSRLLAPSRNDILPALKPSFRSGNERTRFVTVLSSTNFRFQKLGRLTQGLKVAPFSCRSCSSQATGNPRRSALSVKPSAICPATIASVIFGLSSVSRNTLHA
jgi:hypothetical protein